MGVRKIFIVLITVVVCVILGAFVLNIIMPNAVSAMVNSLEATLYQATGMKIDLNGDASTTNYSGAAATTNTFGGAVNGSSNSAQTGAGVQGYK